jgi:hypothetical protein
MNIRAWFLVVIACISMSSIALSQAYNMGNLGTVNNACGGTFYDNGGANGQYSNNQLLTATFCAPAGQAITFSFSDFALEAGFDFLDIYNGPSTASPLLGSFTGNQSPGVLSSAIGGCITFQFFSDGFTRRRGWVAAITCGDPPPPTNTGDDCPDASPFCTGTSYAFPNNTNNPSLGTINCLLTTPNPVWYYMQIQNSGILNIDIAQFRPNGTLIDIDFNLWGPFTSQEDGCLQIAASTAPTVDCSFSSSSIEQANIPNAIAGEFYILLLTNFSNANGIITFNSTSNSTATTDCDILCQIISLTAIPSTCSAATNTYSVSGQLTLQNPPSTGILTFTSSCGGTTTVSAPFANQINYSIPGINSNGSACTVTASFSADANCNEIANYTAPASCASIVLNCPTYAATSTSPSTACSNQTYYLEVENTSCNGQVYFNVQGNYGSTFGNEISWNVTSNLTNAVLASGAGNLSGTNFNIPIGPINPTIEGTIYTLNVFDSYGDGFNGLGGQIYVAQGNNPISGVIAGNFFSSTYVIFGANISVSAATMTVNTPSGDVVQTVQNCSDFRIPISINNANYCHTISADLPWTITCNSSGATISSGSNTLTVYPTLPSTTNDVASISWNSSSCTWDVTANNDCDLSDLGTIFTISPDPSSLTGTACTSADQAFNLNYLGLSGGPNCCSTGGTLIPVAIDSAYSHGSYVVANSPFGGMNNAAYLNIPANGIGGIANSLTLNIDMQGFCMDPAGPNTFYDYWVTIFVDGIIVSDWVSADPGPAVFSQTINLSDIALGFNSNSVIEVYIYPNIYENGTGTVLANYVPNLACASLTNGLWSASSITANLQVNFSEYTPTPASCDYPTSGLSSCCAPVAVSNGSSTICSNGSTSAVTAWSSNVASANPTCLVYSSVTPVAGSVLPDNSFPNGINSTSSPITQSVSAYAYCDANGSGTVNTGDTYTLISTYDLTVTPQPNAGSNGSVSICANATSINLFGYLGGSPAATGAWTGPSTLTAGNLGTFDPSTNLEGDYIYTVTGSSPCSDATSTVTVSIGAGPNATITYPNAPYCKDITAPQVPTISGSSGGVFSSAPAGLSLNTSTGAIVPSTSTAGTYTITYDLAATGGCAAFSTIQNVVINDIPASPTLTPNPVCDGIATTMTAGNGSWYEFYVDGVVQAPASAVNTWLYSVPVSGSSVCVRSYPPPPFVYDGSFNESAWGTPLATSVGGPTSGFAPNNNLDALFLHNSGGYLSGAIAGQTENNSNNRILMFIDCAPGGFNNLGAWSPRNNAPYVSVENLNGLITFDPGFDPDYILSMNEASGIAYFDLYDMQGNSNNYLGSDISSTLLGYQANGAQFNNSQGFEFAIPMNDLGNPSGTIKVFLMLVNDPGLGSSAATFISNQFLTHANDGESNYGDGFIDFGAAAPNPISYSLSADCYSETCVSVSTSTTPVTGFTYTPKVCVNDPDIGPSPTTGFTTGGTYSSTAGLSINASTGLIDVSASLPATYTVTYTIPASGCNPLGSSTFSVTIDPLPLTTPIYHD